MMYITKKILFLHYTITFGIRCNMPDATHIITNIKY